ncbi:MAG: DUF1588 domain-containing protein [Planctomycetota bacterium]
MRKNSRVSTPSVVIGLAVLGLVGPVAAVETPTAETLPATQQMFLTEHCLDCHSGDAPEAELAFDDPSIDWSDEHALAKWERVLDALHSHEMPPPDASDLGDKTRTTMVDWIDHKLLQETAIGGTEPRRLNQTEYRSAVQSLFGLKNFQLPPGFPIDREHHGFDNLGEGLVLSPPLMEAYSESARLIADQIFPPLRSAPKPTKSHAGAKDLVISYSSSKVVGDAMRLGMKCNPLHRSCTWPARIETTASGEYTVTVSLSAFRPSVDVAPMVAKIFARDVASSDGVSHKTLRLLKEITVTSESPETFTFDAILYEGQTVVLHWANASLDSDREDKDDLVRFFREKNEQNPRYLAAWHAMVKGESQQGFRGGVGWDRVKGQLSRKDLPAISADEEEEFFKRVVRNPVLYAETVVFDVFENGPALQIHDVAIKGPRQLVDGPREREAQRLRDRLFGSETSPERIIERLLTQAFRRPVTEETTRAYLGVYESHIDAGHSADEAMHLVIRNVLISPRFLYRCLQPGPLDDHDLATRLSFFLTGRPADSKLLSKVGQLSKPQVLRGQAERLLPKKPTDHLIVDFTEQWLDTRLLADIMPDPQFKFSARDMRTAKSEVEYLFAEILKANRPMSDFIDPDFTFTSTQFAKKFYGLKKGFDGKKQNTTHRIELPRGGRYGGLLGSSAVLTATANGVDTQPVLRGVWVLENILGSPPPPPPNAVPPITPDTNGAKTPRDLLRLHTSESSCAGCHRKIDPVGLVLENFDPVGRWRERWPDVDRVIDAASTLPDGTEIRDVVDFKAWLVDNIDLFSCCLAEKLMTYATGRVLNYSERHEIETLVKANHESGNGFRDLVLTLITSDTFRTK